MSSEVERPPAQPSYILRGHSAQIHAVHFYKSNSRLLTGDADGWVVSWNVTTKRGVVVWRPHTATILGLNNWNEDKVITHGRDNRLHVWQIGSADEATLSTILPIDDSSTERKQPWLLHTLTVNALNFCAFAVCLTDLSEEILVATPGLQDGHVNVTSLPNEARIATVPGVKDTNTGMVMTIRMWNHLDDQNSTCDKDRSPFVLAGYESGHVCLWTQQDGSKQWTAGYLAQPHTQPVLSLDIAPSLGVFFTSSADAILARHPLHSGMHPKIAQTRHAGQQSLTVRPDGRIFATAGWDGRVRVYSPKTLTELAVLKWHKEGCYALAFAQIASPALGTSEPQQALTEHISTVSMLRRTKAERTHWIAAGSKDGKVSLWDIY